MIAASAVADKTVEIGAEVNSGRFCELFEAYQPALRRLVSAYVANPSDREDLLQDIAAGIWKSLPAFRREASERTWIYRIAHNIAIRNCSRVRSRSAREMPVEGSFDRASEGRGAEETLLLDERVRALMGAIRELPVLDRQMVTLQLEGLSASEIEEVTGVSRGAVATRLSRMRQRLAERLQGDREP
ncbi:MAG: RNA polymerase sigma factor [Acidobacteriaceae bacterium]|nr:RNA polymerase sigma factor [Acidobacteriaceae bacterium]